MGGGGHHHHHYVQQPVYVQSGPTDAEIKAQIRQQQ
jgi:hypothetical protein